MDKQFIQSFRNPPDEYCSGIRYVIPPDFQAFDSDYRARLVAEVTDLYEKGYRLLELELKLPKNTPEACEVSKLIYRTANRLGLIVDFRLDWPETQSMIGHAKYLTNGNGVLTIAGGSALQSGTILPPAKETIQFQAGTVRLEAVLAVRTETIGSLKYQREIKHIPLSDITYSDYLRNEDGSIQMDGSLNPLTPKVAQSINVCKYTGPDLILGVAGETWDILTYYCVSAVATPCPFLDNSVFVYADYYSISGAEDFVAFYESGWDTELRRLMRENGGYMTSDGGDHNQPINVSSWSDELIPLFHKQFGYDLMDYLPVQFSGYALEGDAAERINNDYYHAFSLLFCEFNQYIEAWAQCNYNTHYRAQIGYSTDLDTQMVVQSIGQTDLESLWCQDQISSYLSMTTVTDLMRNKPVSVEMGAMARGYGCKWSRLLTEINTAFMAGANKMIFHVGSFPISPTAKWPGYTCFSSDLADWGPTSPQYEDTRSITSYVDRAQYIIRRGTSLRDIAIYTHTYEESAFTYKPDSSLTQAGYTYGIFSPAAMTLPNGKATSSRMIDPEGAGYRAFVLRMPHTVCSRDTKPLVTPMTQPVDEMGLGDIPYEPQSDTPRIPIQTVETILDYANAGIPVIVIGVLPMHAEGYSELANGLDDTAELSALWSQIDATGMLTVIEHEQSLVKTLREKRIMPRLENPECTDLASYQCMVGEERYYLLYNMEGIAPQAFTLQSYTPSEPKQLCQQVLLEGCGFPYVFDLWNGTIRPIPHTRLESDRVAIDIALNSGDTVMIGMLPDTPEEICETQALLKIIPQKWTLQVEQWFPRNSFGTTGFDGAATKKRQLPSISLDALVPWNRIDALGDTVSGFGTYCCTFETETEADGLFLDLGDVYDSVQIWLDGELIPVNQITHTADAREIILPGSHLLKIRVASNLLNQAAALGIYQGAVGNFQLSNDISPEDYGLLGPVVITPYKLNGPVVK